MPTLSCEQCRTRKTKCDKLAPCSACKSAGLACHVVQRDRLPRGRTSKSRTKDFNLETRVARLEELLKQASANAQKEPVSRSRDSPSSGEPTSASPSSNKLDTFVASQFWTALSDEVAGIRETLHEVSDDEETPPSTTGYGHDGARIDADNSIIFPRMITGMDNRGICLLSFAQQSVLLEAYQYRVDPIIKPLHWPTTCRNFAQTDVNDATSSVNALRNAVFYLTLCSLSEQECIDSLGREKNTLLIEQRVVTEISIATAGILVNPDIPGLQAFVLYLQALRSRKAQALNWTLLAIAVRLAIALGLNGQSQNLRTDLPNTLDLEIRRRLWYAICLMDVQATLDRGSAPMITADDVGPPPQNIDDDNVTVVQPPERWTSMSFALMTTEAMRCHKNICDVPRDVDGDWTNWNRKIAMFSALEESFRQKQLLFGGPDATPIQKWATLASMAMIADMRLLLRRPAFRRGKNPVPPWDEFNSLLAATESLERHLFMHSSRNEGAWSWQEWTPWYALAVSLAELCRSPHGELADKAYCVAYAMFDLYAVPATDPDRGMLWKPIAKLWRRVNTLRNQPSSVLGSMSVSNESVLPMQRYDGGTPQLSTEFMPLPSVLPPSREMIPPIPMDAYEMPFAGMGYSSPTNLDLAFPVTELDPQDGVSWLDWENLMQISNPAMR